MSTAVKKRPMRHKSGKVAALLTTRWTASAKSQHNAALDGCRGGFLHEARSKLYREYIA
jgi:hypothetical protein